MLETRLKYNLANLQRSDLEHESYQKIQAQTLEQLDVHEAVLLPWGKKQRVQAERKELKKLSTSWEEVFGKLSDPETQRGIKETVEAMKKMRIDKAENRKRLENARNKMFDNVQKQREERRRKHDMRSRSK